MKLQLEKPIVFLDIEATGLDLEIDRIVELALCKVHPDGTREVKTNRYNPEMHIPEETTEIHGITDEDVKDKPLFKQHAKGILAFIEGCDLAGFNSNRYDVPLLANELSRSGHYFDHKKHRLIDVGNIFKIKEPRTLEAAVKFYCGEELVNAHSAEADIMATVDVFQKQLERYEDLPSKIDELALMSNHDKPILDLAGKFSVDDKGEIILMFGKHRGKRAKDHIDFLDWMVNRASFPRDTVQVALSIMDPYYNV